MKAEHADVVLVYPQRAPAQGRHWIMPSLGLMYLSATLRRAGYTVRHIDHTFLERREVVAPSFDWAGLTYIFNGPFAGTTYHINVQEAK